jgi:hypothetical protein
MAAVLDRAGASRPICVYCGAPIASGAVIVVDRSARRRGHLPCAIADDRDVARAALTSPETSPKLVSEVLEEVSRSDPELADEARTSHRRIQMTRAQPKSLDDPTTAAMLRDIEADPKNRGLYSVLADHLQQLGDERGELIVLDLSEPTESAALVRRRELAGSLTPLFAKLTARFSWSIGFLRKIELPFAEGSLGDHREAFAHPSCRLLEVLSLGTKHKLPITIPRDVLPKTLRTLTVAALLTKRSDLASLPQLTHLTLMDVEAPIEHPTLRSLDLDYASVETMTRLDPKRLPMVTKLSLVRCSEIEFLHALEQRGWLARLTDLSMSLMPFTRDSHEILERGLAGRKLARLAIDPYSGAFLDRARLEPLCDVLEVPSTATRAAEPVYVEHVNKPEWGRGRVVREFDGKVEIEFPSGKRTLKADAPFLKRVSRTGA